MTNASAYRLWHWLLVWQTSIRRSSAAERLLVVLIATLFARTVAYNYDFSLSVKDNAYHLQHHLTPLKRQPIKTKKPRALANITVSMAQQMADLKKDCPLTNLLVPEQIIHRTTCEKVAVVSLANLLVLAHSPPPDLCVLHAIFRI
jgi:hypothetical protein